MSRLFLCLAAALASAASGAQTLQIGNDITTPNASDVVVADVQVDVDLVRPATATGVLDTATFQWSSTGCLGAVEIKFYRRQGDTLVFLGERGPFDVLATPMPVTLTPPMAVQEGDLIGIQRLVNCGNAVTSSGFASAGYVAYSGDSHSDLSLSAADAISPDVLAVFATGTATESVVRVIPTVGSTPGAFGSFFKTGVQLHNPWDTEISGRFVYHPQGVSGSSADPSLLFTVGAGQTVAYADLVQTMGQVGLGSIDVVLPETSQIPIIITRVFNDAGSVGTSGFTEDAFDPDGGGSENTILFAGSTGFLVGPADVTNFRFNIGVRTLLSGAFVTFTVHDATGAVVQSVTKTYLPTYFEQTSSDTLLGTTLQPNDTIEISVSSGSAIIYGATTDNTTNDPSIQFVRVSFAIL
ncbi:MAG: hypothetical protein ABI968_05910 [Acidobacteriota bacterium]